MHHQTLTSTRAGAPRIGVALPTFGEHACPEAVAYVAAAAERLGFDSLSATERLLLPAAPGWVNAAGLPESAVWDPVEMLTWAAAHTVRIRLVTTILTSLFQPPVVLARRLATLDRLSGGRLDVGVGQGWLPEEFAAVGLPPGQRGARFEEHLAAMRACWAPDPVEYAGTHYRIPVARIGPKPANGRLDVYVGAVSRPAVERAARIGDGFVTAVRDWDTSATEIRWYREAGGTGPAVARVMSRWCADDPDSPAVEFAAGALGDLDQATRAGADEVHWELNLTGRPEPRRQVEALEALADILDHP